MGNECSPVLAAVRAANADRPVFPFGVRATHTSTQAATKRSSSMSPGTRPKVARSERQQPSDRRPRRVFFAAEGHFVTSLSLAVNGSRDRPLADVLERLATQARLVP